MEAQRKTLETQLAQLRTVGELLDWLDRLLHAPGIDLAAIMQPLWDVVYQLRELPKDAKVDELPAPAGWWYRARAGRLLQTAYRRKSGETTDSQG